MMTRGRLEDWAVRLYMIYGHLRVPKAEKARTLRSVKVQATKMTEKSLIDHIEIYLIKLEAR